MMWFLLGLDGAGGPTGVDAVTRGGLVGDGTVPIMPYRSADAFNNGPNDPRVQYIDLIQSKLDPVMAALAPMTADQRKLAVDFSLSAMRPGAGTRVELAAFALVAKGYLPAQALRLAIAREIAASILSYADPSQGGTAGLGGLGCGDCSRCPKSNLGCAGCTGCPKATAMAGVISDVVGAGKTVGKAIVGVANSVTDVVKDVACNAGVEVGAHVIGAVYGNAAAGAAVAAAGCGAAKAAGKAADAAGNALGGKSKSNAQQSAAHLSAAQVKTLTNEGNTWIDTHFAQYAGEFNGQRIRDAAVAAMTQAHPVLMTTQGKSAVVTNMTNHANAAYLMPQDQQPVPPIPAKYAGYIFADVWFTSNFRERAQLMQRADAMIAAHAAPPVTAAAAAAKPSISTGTIVVAGLSLAGLGYAIMRKKKAA